MFDILKDIFSGSSDIGLTDLSFPKIDSIGQLLGMAINIIMGIGISIAVIAIMMSGIQFIMSEGDPQKLDKAKSSLTWSFAALIISFGALSAKVIIVNLFGVTSLDLISDTPGF